jgi:hypothetical protein
MKHRRIPTVALVATVMHFSSPAAADETPGKTPMRDVWYGWQTLSADAAAVALSIGVGQLDAKAGGYTFLGGYLLGGPTVHVFNKQYGKAGISLALRAGLPLTLGLGGLLVGSSQCKDDKDDGNNEVVIPCDVVLGATGAVVGIFTGLVAGSLLDMAFLAKKKEPVQEGVSWSPVLTPRQGGVMLGAVGRW